MTEAPTPEDLGAHVDRAAKLIGLPILPEHRAGVIQAMAVITAAATLVMDFPLPDDVEAAPVFEP
ncbi:MAG TPA: DUF4089 domain-containing protein [Methylomirabilota bacterium]